MKRSLLTEGMSHGALWPTLPSGHTSSISPQILAVGICRDGFPARAFASICLNQFRLAGREQQASEIARVEVSRIPIRTHDATLRMRVCAQQQMTELVSEDACENPGQRGSGLTGQFLNPL